MGTISSAFGIISGALNADQAALGITAGNVANANTPGYSRQTANWRENQPVTMNGIAYGSGVTETGATSIRDRVLLERLDQQQQMASASSSRLSALNTLQALFTPDSGSANSRAGDIGNDITGFFNSWSSLEANPGNNAYRQQVLSTASTLAADISNAASSVNVQRGALDQEATSVAGQVNALTASLAQLNAQIQSTSAGADAGTLEDQRQQDLSQLSQLIGINQVKTENNGLTITTGGGQTLVSEGTSFNLTTGKVGGVADFFIGGTDVTGQLMTGGGSLGGYLTARDQDIPSVLGALDQLAYGISTEVNAQNQAGIDLVDPTGADVNAKAIFSTPPHGGDATTNLSQLAAGAALSMRVTMTDPTRIAAASAGNGSGDNLNATALANLGTLSAPPILNGMLIGNGQPLLAGETLLNGQSPIGLYSGFVTTLGSTVSEVQTESTAQSASVTQLQTQNNALSQVNLNDEASAMTTMERSYQAAAQVFAMLNTVMASALNLGAQSTVA